MRVEGWVDVNNCYRLLTALQMHIIIYDNLDIWHMWLYSGHTLHKRKKCASTTTQKSDIVFFKNKHCFRPMSDCAEQKKAIPILTWLIVVKVFLYSLTDIRKGSDSSYIMVKMSFFFLVLFLSIYCNNVVCELTKTITSNHTNRNIWCEIIISSHTNQNIQCKIILLPWI
jgi:hypothetical protein